MGIETVLIAALVVSTAATGFSVAQTAKANKARRRQALQQSNRARREQVRSARIRRAAIVNPSVAGGTSTSAESGAVAGIQAQLSSNLGFLDNQLALQRKALSADSLAAVSGGVASIATGVANVAGTQLAKPKPPTTPLDGIF